MNIIEHIRNKALDVASEEIVELGNKVNESKDYHLQFAMDTVKEERATSRSMISKLIKAIIILAIIAGVQFLVMVGAVLWFWNNVEVVDEVEIIQTIEWPEGEFYGRDMQNVINPSGTQE